MSTVSKVGDRLAEPPAPELIKYLYTPSSADSYADQFEFMTAINKAHVVMLYRQGVIEKDVARKLLQALVEVEARGHEGLDFDPSREDLYFNYEHAVVTLTGANVGGQMHTGRSRNDLGATMVRMRTRELILSLADEVVQLRSALIDRAEEYAEVVFPGYTHLQPAQPVSLGHYFTAIEAGLSRDTERLLAAYDTTNASSLGAAASAGTGFPIDREFTARLLGFPAVAVNTLDAVATRDYLLETLAAGTIMAATVNRHVQDLYVWYTQEFGLIDFRDRVSGTSSIMPQKKNPVLLESVKGRTAHLIGAFTSAIAGIRNSHYQNIIDANRIGFEPTWPALEQLKIGLILTRVAAENLKVNRQRALERCARDFSTVTQLADTLVTRAGVSFREAHEIVGGTVRRVLDAGGDATTITASDVQAVALEQFGLSLELDEKAVRQALDPTFGVGLRSHTGGPAPVSVRSMTEAARARIAETSRKARSLREELSAAAASLSEEVKSVLAE